MSNWRYLCQSGIREKSPHCHKFYIEDRRILIWYIRRKKSRLIVRTSGDVSTCDGVTTNTLAFFVNPPCETNETLVQFLLYLQKQPYAESTIQTKYKILRIMLQENAKLDDPELIKLYINRKQSWKSGHKILAIYTYNDYCTMRGIKWEIPIVERIESPLPSIPTQKEIDAPINGTSKKISIVLQALEETGFRIGELWNCKWTDLDEEKSTIKCITEKHGLPREVRISAELLARLNTLPKRNDYIFGHTRLNYTRTVFDYQENRLAEKLNNPRLKQIYFHTFRHHHATKLYNETKSILEVKARLGHRRLDSTMVYTHIVDFDEESQNYHHAIAHDEEEAGREDSCSHSMNARTTTTMTK